MSEYIVVKSIKNLHLKSWDSLKSPGTFSTLENARRAKSMFGRKYHKKFYIYKYDGISKSTGLFKWKKIE